MITRDAFWRSYSPTQPQRANTPGYMRVTQVNNIDQTWAITRPGSQWESNTTPPYMGNAVPPNDVRYGGALGLVLPRNRVMMDPTDQTTWQRSYRFT